MTIQSQLQSSNRPPEFVWHFPRGADSIGHKCSQFSIVGTHSNDVNGFVQHVSLLATECELKTSSEVPVWHMGPPIYTSSSNSTGLTSPKKCRADLIAQIPLTSDNRKSMLHWKAKIEKEERPGKPFEQYVVAPSVLWVRSETGRRLYRRFSCAGFVMSCYSSAGIVILNKEASLPEVSVQDVELAYPQFRRLEEAPEQTRARVGFAGLGHLGIAGDGPWRIVLAGYLFHALRRFTQDNPKPDPHTPESVAEAYYPLPTGLKST
jgi:hypothetical protein